MADLWKTFNEKFIGFDDMLDGFTSILSNRTDSFPPYNLIQTTADDFVIEFALAGWDIDDIEIYHQTDGVLTVSSKEGPGRTNALPPKYPKTIHRGISKRDFNTSFKVSKDIALGDVTFENGLLTIKLSNKKVTKPAVERNKVEINKK